MPWQEVEALCSSIALRQKYSKLEAKLRASLAEMEEERQRNLAEKVKQREELQTAAEEIRQVWENSHTSVVRSFNVLNGIRPRDLFI